MYRRIIDEPEILSFPSDGKPLHAAPGDTLVAALLRAGIDTFRTSVVSGAPRGPHCLMGVSFDCLVNISVCIHVN